ncbi:MAG: hypothetical protein C5B48_07955 [Candidatus Rokuibacteriota bacterium]|nr:MAG: hypothetical protein C5B48_07955 [Candidatus Rokubacteria bacterium]
MAEHLAETLIRSLLERMKTRAQFEKRVNDSAEALVDVAELLVDSVEPQGHRTELLVHRVEPPVHRVKPVVNVIEPALEELDEQPVLFRGHDPCLLRVPASIQVYRFVDSA